MKRIRFIALCMVIFLLAGGVAAAQGDDYDVGRWVTSTGGGERESGDYMIIDVIGQTAAGLSRSEGYLLYSGFYGPYQALPITEPIAVGGDVYPVNKMRLLIPWIALAIVIIAGVIFLVRRKAQSYK